MVDGAISHDPLGAVPGLQAVSSTAGVLLTVSMMRQEVALVELQVSENLLPVTVLADDWLRVPTGTGGGATTVCVIGADEAVPPEPVQTLLKTCGPTVVGAISQAPFVALPHAVSSIAGVLLIASVMRQEIALVEFQDSENLLPAVVVVNDWLRVATGTGGGATTVCAIGVDDAVPPEPVQTLLRTCDPMVVGDISQVPFAAAPGLQVVSSTAGVLLTVSMMRQEVALVELQVSENLLPVTVLADD